MGPGDDQTGRRVAERHTSRERGADRVLREQRRTFDRQVATLENIDDKAARTVRISVLTIGFVVSAAGVIVRNGDTLPLLTVVFGMLGLFALLRTVVLGAITFDRTQYKTRLTDEEYERLRQEGTNERLQEAYRTWTRNARSEIRENSDLFARTQRALLAGVVSLSVAGTGIVVPALSRPFAVGPIQSHVPTPHAASRWLVTVGIGLGIAAVLSVLVVLAIGDESR